MTFPPDLAAYNDAALPALAQLANRVALHPFNLVATLIFLGAVLHTFFASFILKLSRKLENRYLHSHTRPQDPPFFRFLVQLTRFLSEIEVVFAVWALVLLGALVYFFDWPTARDYFAETVSYREPLFVLIVMAASATRPILQLAEGLLEKVAAFGGNSPLAWWFSILTLGPLLGSLITEPAAMTISAFLLGKHFYRHHPSVHLAYATLALLFVNISVGGTFTHFAAPPVVMVAHSWGWDTLYMISHFGWKALLGIILANTVYFLLFQKELRQLKTTTVEEHREVRIPLPVTLVHIAFLIWIVSQAHFPVMICAGMLGLIAFMQMTPEYQRKLDLKHPTLVGVFLAGLVIHGGLQGWWISPLMSRLNPFALFGTATVLTAFNDNAAITYLSTLVPGFSEHHRYAVLAGAVVGGGLTVIANAPNPAGQSILAPHFRHQLILPVRLFLAAMIPTVILFACFWLL